MQLLIFSFEALSSLLAIIFATIQISLLREWALRFSLSSFSRPLINATVPYWFSCSIPGKCSDTTMKGRRSVPFSFLQNESFVNFRFTLVAVVVPERISLTRNDLLFLDKQFSCILRQKRFQCFYHRVIIGLLNGISRLTKWLFLKIILIPSSFPLLSLNTILFLPCTQPNQIISREKNTILALWLCCLFNLLLLHQFVIPFSYNNFCRTSN